MGKYTFSRDGGASDGPRIKNRGEIALEVSSIDHKSNVVTGFDLSTGEELTMNFATVGEYADFYADRRRFTTANDREQEASKQLAKQPSGKGLTRSGVEEGDVVQFQSVKELTDGKLIARWANSITTNASAGVDAYRRMEIQISIPTDDESTKKKYPRRTARAYDMGATEPASLDALERMTDGQVRRHTGGALAAPMRNSVLIAVSDGVETKSVGVDMPWGDNGPATGVDALFSKKLDNFDFRQVSALAGRVGVPFEKLAFAEAGSRNAPKNIAAALAEAKDIHAAAASGELGVTITPGFTGDLMLHAKTGVIQREKWAATNTRSITLSERGFFTADVALMANAATTNPETGVTYSAQTAFKTVLPAEFLKPVKDDNFIRRRISDLGDTAMEIGLAKDRAAVFAPAAGYTPETSAPKQEEPEARKNHELSTDGPGF